MSVCPFCKAQVAQSTAPCPSCGKLASDHPSIAAMSGRTLSTDFDDDDHGELSLEAGPSAGHGSGMPYESGKGVTLDDDFFGDGDAAGPLELDVPAKPPAPPVPDLPVPPPAAPGSQPRMAAPAPPPPPPAHAPPPPPASSSGRLPAAPSSPDLAPAAAAPPAPKPPADQAALRIANYPPVPEKVWEAPRYAARVLLRQLELRQDLESLRRKRSPDVGLYERALKAHDPRMFLLGVAMSGGVVALLVLLSVLRIVLAYSN